MARPPHDRPVDTIGGAHDAGRLSDVYEVGLLLRAILLEARGVGTFRVLHRMRARLEVHVDTVFVMAGDL